MKSRYPPICPHTCIFFVQRIEVNEMKPEMCYLLSIQFVCRRTRQIDSSKTESYPIERMMLTLDSH